MKLKHATTFLPLILSALASAHAATVTRTGTADLLTAAAAWSPAAAPTLADTATWDSASTLANATTALTAALTWGGLNISSAAGNVSMAFTGNFTSNFGAINTGTQNLAITTGAANNTLTFTSVTGTGVLTLHNGTTNLGMAQLNTANALNFNGTLTLRGGNATTSTGTTAGSFFYLGRTGITQASGTAFALDTGSSTTSAKDVILDGDAWNGKTLNITSLSGFGSLRSDSGSGGLKTLRIDQAGDTTFNGLVLSHTSGAGAVRRLALDKQGAGKLTLAGVVGKQTASAGAAASDIDITVSAGTLALTAQNTRTGSTTIASGATLQAGDGGSSGLIGGSAVTNNGALVFNYGSGANVTIPNVISGNGSISKTGDGTLAFTGNSSTFSGNIELSAGSLRIGPNTGTGILTAKNGTFISVGLAATSGTSVVGGLTLENGTESDFRLGTTNDKINVTTSNGLTVPGPGETHTINLFNDPVAGGTITLIDYTGTPLTTDQFNRIILGILPSLGNFELIHNTANTSIDLLITLPNQLWKGFADGNWDDTTLNWAMEGTPAVPTVFSSVNPVIFNDSASNFNVVVGVSGVAPLSLTFNNTTTPYTFTGGEILGSSSLVKNGAAQVTLSQSNSYSGGTIVNSGSLVFDGLANTSSGGTTINGGTLRIGSGGATGDIGGGPIVIGSGALLEFDRENTTPGTADLNYKTSVKMRNVSGAGNIVLDGGLLFFNYTGAGTGFSEAGSWNNFSGGLSIKGGSEFQTIRNGATAMGTGIVTLGDATSSGALSQIEGNWTWTNPIVLVGSDNRIRNRSAGTLRALKLQGVVSGSGGLTVEDIAGSMTDVNRGFILTQNNTFDGTLTIGIGTPLRVGGIPGEVDASNPGLLAAAAGTLGSASVVNNGILTISRTDAHSIANPISGTGAIRIGIPAAATLGDTSTQVFTYTGSATHSGTTTVHNGSLIIASGATMGGSSLTVEATATLGGSGTVNAPVTANGTVSPGTAIGLLTVGGNTSLNGSLAIQIDGTNSDKLVVTGDLTLAGALTVGEQGTGFTQNSYVVAECTGTLSGSLTVPDGYILTVSGNQLILTKASTSAYLTWIGTFSLGGLTGIDEDPDNDGLDNGTEFVLKGGNPEVAGGTQSPSASVSGSNLVFTFERDDRAKGASAGVSVSVESGTDLASWPVSFNVLDDTAASTAGVVVSNDGDSNPDTITVTIPTSGAPKFFARLKVSDNP
jgi:autotransporter-associated beta strand protein